MIATLCALAAISADNTLSSKEAKAGWKLLFDGKTTRGWSNYKTDTLRDGWQVINGALTVADPENAGDIVSKDKFGWFELKIDFKYEPGQNSGIMFHVDDTSDATWHSGPEVQIYDHKLEKGVEISGALYQLYEPTVNSARPAGQWNTFDILISKKRCWTKVNGVKYYEYVLGSDDFWKRVAKSKFSEYKQFAKSASGRIAIQGDHGKVAFKNIKIRRLKA